jgi:DNA-binding MarR family transcriptional regulator
MTTLRRVSGQPTWLLSRANTRAQQILQDAFRNEGFRGYHFRLLAALDEHGPASQADLGRRTGLDRSDVTNTLSELVARRLARRAPDPDDRRRNVIVVTEQGVEVLERLDAVLAGVQDAVLAPLSERERSTLVRLLAKLG